MKSGDILQGTVSLEPYILGEEIRVARFELFVDGKRFVQAKLGEPLELDTTQLSDGFHELRVVSIEDSPIETQSRSGLTCVVNNEGLACELTGPPDRKLVRGDVLTLTAESTGAARIDIHAPGQIVATVTGERGEVEIDTSQLGFGPLTLWTAHHEGHEGGRARAPLNLQIVTPAPLPAVAVPAESRLVSGLSVTIGSLPARTLVDTKLTDCLETAGLSAGQGYRLEGYFEVPREDVYQFQTSYLGKLALRVDGVTIYEGESNRFNPLKYAPVMLAEGLHHLEVVGEAGPSTKFELRFGGEGTYRVDGEVFRHLR